MKFTGERYITDLNLAEISYEHWHRYFYATQFVKDKQVLDIACGEGYGANLMAQTAETVVGVDISQEAIDFAKERYPRGNLSFLQGSVEKIPIDGAKKFDVVVSFETIEHVDAGMQESFLNEVRRLLKDDGVFVISSPNKLFWISKLKNEFHLKEFYEKEFVEFLRKYFGQVTLLGQKVFTGSDMWMLDSSSRAGLFVEYQITNEGQRFVANDDKKEAIYLVAVCSNSKIKVVENSFLVDNSLSILSERDVQIASLKQAVYDRDVRISILNQVITDRDNQITALNQAVGDRDIQIMVHKHAVADRDNQITVLNAELTALNAELKKIKSSLSWKLTMPLRFADSLLRGYWTTIRKHLSRSRGE
jgi:ubiquinone/menaquinone biosynthesis C-methylase UbiE